MNKYMHHFLTYRLNKMGIHQCTVHVPRIIDMETLEE